MNEEEQSATESREFLLSLIQRIDTVYSNRFEILEKKVETYEQQLALLTQGYAELAILVQTIMEIKLDEIDTVAFRKHMEKNGEEMLEILRNGAAQGKTDHENFHPGITTLDDTDDTGDTVSDS